MPAYNTPFPRAPSTTDQGVRRHAVRGAANLADDASGGAGRDRSRAPQRGRYGSGPAHGDVAPQSGVRGAAVVALPGLLPRFAHRVPGVPGRNDYTGELALGHRKRMADEP